MFEVGLQSGIFDHQPACFSAGTVKHESESGGNNSHQENNEDFGHDGSGQGCLLESKLKVLRKMLPYKELNDQRRGRYIKPERFSPSAA